MNEKKLIPYVELIARPRHRGTVRARSSPEPSPETPNSPKLSPRKKRRIQNDDPLEGNLTNRLAEIKVSRPRRLSTTASKSAMGKQESSASTSSCTLFQRDTDTESRVPTSKYMTTEVILEDEDIVVHGETPLNDDEREEGEVPVRLLDEFVIYDTNSLEAVPLASLLNIPDLRCEFSASGFVKPWIEGDSDDEDESEDSEHEDDRGRMSVDPQWDRLSLSQIREFAVHSPTSRKGRLDGKLYIRTDFAWYILGFPSRQYVHLFRPFWLQHRILHLLVIASTDQTRLTYQAFTDKIQHLDEAEENIFTSKSILGRSLTKRDVESPEVVAYIRSTLDELHQQRIIQISRVAAIREILGPVHYQFETDISARNPDAKRKIHAVSKADVVPVKHKKVTPASKTFLTPVVNRIAKNLFKGSLEVAEIDHYGEEHDSTSIKQRKHKAHHTNPAKIIWGERLVENEEIYASVIVDGITYQMGDIVMVEPDGNEQTKTSHASQTMNKYGNRWWFCQIRYFHREGRGGHFVKMFHGQWFVHGCKTILQETSHSKALYLLKKGCDSNPISSILQKCNVTILRHDDDEVADDGDRDANDFHCGLMYDDDVTSFEDLPPEALLVDERWGYISCYSCALKEEAEFCKDVRLSEAADEVVVYGEAYHVHDFVYIHPSGSGQLLSIGQVVEVKKYKETITVQVRFLGRYNEYVREQRKKDTSELESDLTFDERRLFYTDDIRVVPAHKLERRCHVRHLTDQQQIEEWIEPDDHFYLNQVGSNHQLSQMKKRDFGYCAECRAEDERCRSQRERFLSSNSKLIGMELFSGAGGLGIGMGLSGLVETKYAVEYEPSAAKTYKTNHPETIVYCQDSSSLLKHAVAVMNNEEPPPLLSKDGQTLCPPMPRNTDQIDFIFGGPPCQSFSKANHSKRHDDIRSTMPCNMLSYVEHYQPNYFLLENVAGFLEHHIESTLTTSSGDVLCTIKFGMVKFVTRALIALGYQVRYRLLQAGQYGVPQSRSRVIFWGAKRSLVLPDFPIPIYAFPRGPTRVTLPTEGKLEPVTRSKNPDEFHHFAPLKAITVDDAASDLMPFEWINPHVIIPARPQDRAEARRRRDILGIFQFDADVSSGERELNNLPGFPRGVEYAKKPQNRYQKWLRRGVGENASVTAHYTTRWKPKIIEATANVPLQALADHRDLDDVFLSERARMKHKNNKLVLYGRLDPESQFKCAVTTLSPVVKNQWPLHPSLKRVISVREAARAQGFPDSFSFESVNTEAGKVVRDQLRQIGNAVAVPFALALGKELGKALVKDWEKKEREGSVDM